MGTDKWKETIEEESFLLELLVMWFPNCGVIRLEFFSKQQKDNKYKIHLPGFFFYYKQTNKQEFFLFFHTTVATVLNGFITIYEKMKFMSLCENLVQQYSQCGMY